MKKVFGVSIRMLSFSILAPAFVLGAWAQASHMFHYPLPTSC
jgi:hypothetical protein